jgi:hypothetical protein
MEEVRNGGQIHGIAEMQISEKLQNWADIIWV